MKVIIVLEFPGIPDPDGDEATEIVDELTLHTKQLQEEWAHKGAIVWVDDAKGEE